MLLLSSALLGLLANALLLGLALLLGQATLLLELGNTGTEIALTRILRRLLALVHLLPSRSDLGLESLLVREGLEELALLLKLLLVARLAELLVLLYERIRTHRLALANADEQERERERRRTYSNAHLVVFPLARNLVVEPSRDKRNLLLAAGSLVETHIVGEVLDSFRQRLLLLGKALSFGSASIGSGARFLVLLHRSKREYE